MEDEKAEPGKHPVRCLTMTRVEEHIGKDQEQLPAEISVLNFPNLEPGSQGSGASIPLKMLS